jgi:hypothetical protein
MRAISALLILLLMGCSERHQPSDNAELEALVAADQKDREPDITRIDWSVVSERDAARRKRVLEMIEANQLVTGRDFRRAALVFQHGDGSNDILLAHILAVTALGRGELEARRMAAMSLDRYLVRIGQPQVFGTQVNSANPGDPAAWTMDPFDTGLIGDALRALNCVEPITRQREIVEGLRHGIEPSDDPVCADAK